MNNERNKTTVSTPINSETTEKIEPKTEEKRDKRDWIDREHYTEHGGEG